MLRSSAAVLAVAAVLVAVATSSSPSLERPAWTVGDDWTYATNTTLLPGVNLTGTVTYAVHGRVATSVGGGAMNAWDLFLSGAGVAMGSVTTRNGTYRVNGTWILTAEQQFEPVNLELVYGLFDLQVNGTAGGLVPFSARVQNTTAFQIISTGRAYPLSTGTRAAIEVRYNFTQDSYSSFVPHVHQQGEGDWNLSFSVGTPVTIASAAGEFSSFPQTEIWPDGSRERSFASAEVGNNVRTESYDPGGNLTAVTTLLAYRYQALEPSTFLGLSFSEWIVLGAALVTVAVAIVLVRWRRRRRTPRPPGADASDVTSGPRGP